MINRSTDYAIQIIRTIKKSPKDLLPIPYIAKKNNLSLPFCRRITHRLLAAEIVASTHGRFGGYGLTQFGKKCTLYDLMECLSTAEKGMDLLSPNGYVILKKYQDKLKTIKI